MGTLGIYSIFDNQSAAFVWLYTIKYYPIPSVPSSFEGVKKRPHTTPPMLYRVGCGVVVPLSYPLEDTTPPMSYRVDSGFFIDVVPPGGCATWWASSFFGAFLCILVVVC